ncbi:hypothetical protein ACWDU8_34885 [Streptomyces sp. NPDC003388]
MTPEELLVTYDDARTELDRAHLEAFMIKRRARLAAVQVDPAEEAAAKARIHEAERAVSRSEYALKAAGVRPVRPNTQSAREQRLALEQQQEAAL